MITNDVITNDVIYDDVIMQRLHSEFQNHPMVLTQAIFRIAFDLKSSMRNHYGDYGGITAEISGAIVVRWQNFLVIALET